MFGRPVSCGLFTVVTDPVLVKNPDELELPELLLSLALEFPDLLRLRAGVTLLVDFLAVFLAKKGFFFVLGVLPGVLSRSFWVRAIVSQEVRLSKAYQIDCKLQ